MNRYSKFLLVLAVLLVASLLIWNWGYGGGYFAGSH